MEISLQSPFSPFRFPFSGAAPLARREQKEKRGEWGFLFPFLSYADRGSKECGNLNADKSKSPTSSLFPGAIKGREDQRKFFEGGVGRCRREEKKLWTDGRTCPHIISCTSARSPPRRWVIIILPSRSFRPHLLWCKGGGGEEEEQGSRGKKLQSFRQRHYTKPKARTPFLPRRAGGR